MSPHDNSFKMWQFALSMPKRGTESSIKRDIPVLFQDIYHAYRNSNILIIRNENRNELSSKAIKMMYAMNYSIQSYVPQ